MVPGSLGCGVSVLVIDDTFLAGEGVAQRNKLDPASSGPLREEKWGSVGAREPVRCAEHFGDMCPYSTSDAPGGTQRSQAAPRGGCAPTLGTAMSDAFQDAGAVLNTKLADHGHRAIWAD